MMTLRLMSMLRCRNPIALELDDVLVQLKEFGRYSELKALDGLMMFQSRR